MATQESAPSAGTIPATHTATAAATNNATTLSVRRATIRVRQTRKEYEPSSHLGEKLFGDVLVATGVTFLVSPFLTIVDKATVHSAAGSHTLMQSGIESIKGIIRHPVAYVKSPTFLWMWGVYAATYSTANCLKTITEHQDRAQAKRGATSNPATGQLGVFLGTTIVNSGASMLKDRAYARMFGSSSLPSAIPRMSYAVWMARDLSVIGSSFILPDVVSGYLAQEYGMDQQLAQSYSQIALPVATQFVAGPLHYLGLDLYNRDLTGKRWSEAIADRSRSLYRGFVPVIVAKVARIAPVYGIGGVLNSRLRGSWRDRLIDREVKSMGDSQAQQGPSKIAELIQGRARGMKL